MKTVNLLAYHFDCLPGHIVVNTRGTGHNLRVAVQDAVRKIFKAPQLSRKRINDFKMTVVVLNGSAPNTGAGGAGGSSSSGRQP